jgi:D-inositol-3-phosphate glycosyltransferase
MKRVAIISDHASPMATLGGVDAGGQNVYVAEVAKQLARKGYRVDVFTRWEDTSVDQIINWIHNVRVIHIQAGQVEYIPKENLFSLMGEFTQNMIKFIVEENISYDLVHANFWMSALVASDLKKYLGIPYVITFHALGHVRKLYQKEEDKFPPERVKIEYETAKYADRVIAECPQDKDDLIQYYDLDASKITVIPCGFNPGHFYPVNRSFARKILGLDHEGSIILQLGRMVPRKGVDNVIRALSHLKNCVSKLTLLIVGGETDEPDALKCVEIGRLQQIAKQQGVETMVQFVGRKNRDMLKYYYSAADIFVTTPWYEPFGITPLESMACGTPVIGAEVGGIKYSVKNNETGLLVPPNQPQLLAEKINFLLSEPSIREQMKKNAIERVNALFTWSTISSAIAEMYESVISSYKEEIQQTITSSRLAPVINLETKKGSVGEETKVRKLR